MCSFLVIDFPLWIGESHLCLLLVINHIPMQKGKANLYPSLVGKSGLQGKYICMAIYIYVTNT